MPTSKTKLALLLCCALAAPAHAQLRVYDSTGKVVGHYLGTGRVAVMDGSQRVEAYIYQVAAGDSYATFLYESLDCSGQRLMWGGNWSPFFRDGSTSNFGWMAYGVGQEKEVMPRSYQYVLGVGLGPCGPVISDYPYTLFNARLFQWGKPPFTVR